MHPSLYADPVTVVLLVALFHAVRVCSQLLALPLRRHYLSPLLLALLAWHLCYLQLILFNSTSTLFCCWYAVLTAKQLVFFCCVVFRGHHIS